MATQPNTGGASALPLALLSQAIPMLSRHELESLAERLIDRLDELEPDADLEDDDPCGQCDEDEWNTDLALATGSGPGCMISDDDRADCG